MQHIFETTQVGCARVQRQIARNIDSDICAVSVEYKEYGTCRVKQGQFYPPYFESESQVLNECWHSMFMLMLVKLQVGSFTFI